MGHRILYIPKVSNIFYPEYGLLYNWYASSDSRNIASIGWRLPTRTETDALRSSLGGSQVAGAALKEVSLIYWTSDIGVTNSSGFSARGSGHRSDGGLFAEIRDYAYIASSDEFDNYWRSFRVQSSNSQAVNYSVLKKAGITIRLVSDATGVADGTTTVYIGNDGKIYPAIAINGLYWTQYNLAETLYRNGDPIPEVTDATTWAGLSTGALCAYNNNWSNV